MRGLVEAAGGTLEGADVAERSVVISLDPSKVTRADVERALEDSGFPPEEATDLL